MDELLLDWEDPYPWNQEALYGSFNNSDQFLYAAESEAFGEKND